MAGTPGQDAFSDAPLLASRITLPRLPGWAVPRPRFNERISTGVRGPLTVVTGPPGAGKTVAVASWATSRSAPGPLAWITLSECDSRPCTFWSYVLEALRQSGIPGSRSASTPRPWDAPDHLLTWLASVLAAQDPPVTLVLDDFHFVNSERALLDDITFVLRHAQPGLRLVLASRVDPLLPLHRYRLAGELTEIGNEELAFTTLEAGELLAQHGVTLSAGPLASLVKCTEGWAAGLRFAAMSMGAHGDVEQFVEDAAGAEGVVTEYFMREVLDKQPADVRDFLLRTSILDHVNRELADQLANARSGRILSELVRANAFVHSAGHGWYRYHELFAKVLRRILRGKSPNEVADLHRRAAEWHRRHGSPATAVQHAASAGAWQLAATIVIEKLAIAHLLAPWGQKNLLDMCRQMPDCVICTDPERPLVAAAVALSKDDDHSCTVSLRRAEDILQRLPAARAAPARLAAATIRLTLSRRVGDLNAATAAVTEGETLLHRISKDLRTCHPELHALMRQGHGLVELWAGHVGEAARILTTGVAESSIVDSHGEGDCLGYLALAEALRGQLRRATRLVTDARRLVEHATPAADVAMAYTHLERNKLRDARGWLQRADAGFRRRPDKDRLVGAVAYLVAALTSLAEGHYETVPDMVRRARDGWLPPPWLERRLAVVESRTHLGMGEIEAAFDAAERAGGTSRLDSAVAVARARMVAGDPQGAGVILEHAQAETATAPDQVRLEAWLLDAHLGYRCGNRARGRRSLTRALRLGEREQFRLPFAMERAWLKPVLRRDADLVRAHQRLFDPSLVDPADHRTEPQAPERSEPLVEPLSQREREVLRHLSAVLTTAEIAAEMCLSVNTVKTHLRNIYRKLAATRRGEAIRRARQLGLL